MARVVSFDRLDRGRRLLDARESDEAHSRRKRTGESGVLGHDRPAGGEVGRAAAFEPAAA